MLSHLVKLEVIWDHQEEDKLFQNSFTFPIKKPSPVVESDNVEKKALGLAFLYTLSFHCYRVLEFNEWLEEGFFLSEERIEEIKLTF